MVTQEKTRHHKLVLGFGMQGNISKKDANTEENRTKLKARGFRKYITGTFSENKDIQHAKRFLLWETI